MLGHAVIVKFIARTGTKLCKTYLGTDIFAVVGDHVDKFRRDRGKCSMEPTPEPDITKGMDP